jgi:putative ABC transport system permease protein
MVDISVMKTIDISQQPILSFRRTALIAITGVRYRLFRAAVTVTVIAIAMAFLMNILCESLVKKNVALSARDRISSLHLADKWVARLSIPQAPGDVLHDLATVQTGQPLYYELLGFSGVDTGMFIHVTERARIAEGYLSFFEKLDFGRLRLLVGGAQGIAVFDELQVRDQREYFFENLAKLRSLRFPASTNDFAWFLAEWPKLKQFCIAINVSQTRAIKQVRESLDGRTVPVALTDADGAFGDTIRDAGYVLDAGTARKLVEQVSRGENIRRIDQTIQSEEMKRAIAAREDILPIYVKGEIVWNMLKDTGKAEWYLAEMKKNNLNTGTLDDNQLAVLARFRDMARLLKKAELATLDTGAGGLMGIGERMTWLAFVSMLVCIVGITNAMLMSVTERFREIATLKCLGALDGFIMMVFLVESCIMGLVGGIIGSLAGLLLCLLRMVFIFRSLLFNSFPVGPLSLAVLVSVAAGIIISAIAAVYPSLRAAQLAPMEAMRIE